MAIFNAYCTNTPCDAFTEQNIFIVWTPEYNIGLSIIDEQHRGIVSILNSLHYGMQNDFAQEMLVPTIRKIHEYARIHFHVEERLFEKYKFPKAKTHHELHKKLASNVKEIGRKCILERDPLHFMEFLKFWWIDHICNDDLQFRDYLRVSSAGSRECRAELCRHNARQRAKF